MQTTERPWDAGRGRVTLRGKRRKNVGKGYRRACKSYKERPLF